MAEQARQLYRSSSFLSYGSGVQMIGMDGNYNGAPTDGSAWIGGRGLWGWTRGAGSNSRKVLRGGSWLNLPLNCRCASRTDDIGRDEIYGIVDFSVVCVGARTM
ncbi:MAG: hypothetical protein F6K16_28175 [Symploca sp. SIO2B6]|nr:hypothetical protein [Symploca sp. SIO2B6]